MRDGAARRPPRGTVAGDGRARGPLYRQAEEILTRRLAEGLWRPGTQLPTEQGLAALLGMSTGTVRKALAALERRRLIEKRQGIGTFVAAHTSERALFHFFRIVDLDRRKVAPSSLVLDCRTGAATTEEAALLGLGAGEEVHRVKRLRTIGEAAPILERILLPAALFPGFALPLLKPMTDELYVLYQREYGVTIARAEEGLAAVAAGEEEARLLGLVPGAPLLEIARLARDLSERTVELRVTLLDTRAHRYLAVLE
ncbi:GntR family transcriptional regulator [Falsiroseomonas sp. CW058]|uniref:GntR family transcriptional regulator n=1 Tax=Falsiroseomonas sp. CW058 TaxID=3388664 RepID=UPI003D3133A0